MRLLARSTALAVGSWILIQLVPTGAVASSVAGPHWLLSTGAAYSPSPYGEDTDGAVYPFVAISSVVGRHWSVGAQVQHGEYTDYPGAGRVFFTPVGLGARYWPLRVANGPYLQALFSVIPANWGGVAGMPAGAEVDGGFAVSVLRGVALDAGVSYLKSSGSFSIKVYDGPDIPLKGLNQLLLRAGLSISFGH